MNHHGPMHNERTRRHQMVVKQRREDKQDAIFTMYERAKTGEFGLEVMTEYVDVACDLSLDEVRDLRDALSEHLEAWA